MIRTALDVANDENDLPSIAAAESSLGAVIIERGDWAEAACGRSARSTRREARGTSCPRATRS
jgi:hypothetical protein